MRALVAFPGPGSHETAELASLLGGEAVPSATFSLAEVWALEEASAAEIGDVRARRRAAFDAERARWSRQ
ncbi:hypothetical protein [Geodermatophilus sp. URMC 64]